jgi:hypothetical protein
MFAFLSLLTGITFTPVSWLAGIIYAEVRVYRIIFTL